MEIESILVSLYNEKKNTTEPRSWEERFTALDVFLGKVSKNSRILNSPPNVLKRLQKIWNCGTKPIILGSTLTLRLTQKMVQRRLAKTSHSDVHLNSNDGHNFLQDFTPTRNSYNKHRTCKQNVCTLALDPCSDLFLHLHYQSTWTPPQESRF